MKLAIMQPYFFPYIGYFQLMAAVDEWVIFDDIKFIDKGWVNRNRILHPDIKKEWQYITIPLDKRRQFNKICEITIKHDSKWKQQIQGKLTSYKKKAPYYSQTISFVEDCFDTDETNLSKLLSRTIIKTANYLDIKTRMHVQTEMNLDLGHIEHAGQWALRISEKMGAAEYINPYSGIDLFNKKEFDNAGIELTFMKPTIDKYIQRRGGFVPGLSIIDVLMWNSVRETKNMIGNKF